MHLSKLLDRLPPDRPLWRDVQGGLHTANTLKQYAHRMRRSLGSCHDKRVALLAASDLDLASMLLVFDGYCERLTILPTTADMETIRSVIVASGSDTIISGGADERTRCLGTHVIRRLAQLDGEPSTIESHHQSFENDGDRTTATQWVLPTSGTTGKPKLVSHTLQSLSRAVKTDVERGKEFVWGCLYGLASFAGLQVFLQSWFAGSLLLMNDPRHSLGERLSYFARYRCNALSATPTMWRMILMSGCPTDLVFKTITLGGEIADQAILDGLKRRFPGARIVHIYASTEIGVGFSVRDGREGFPFQFISEPPDGISIKIQADGRLMLRVDDRDRFLIGEGMPLSDECGYVDSGDLVKLEHDRYHFIGRTSGLINVGGMKVHPGEVENVLLKCRGIRMASVSAQRNPITGSIIHAKIVVDSDALESPDAIATRAIACCRNHLEPYMVPATIDVVEAVDVSISGKLRRSTVHG